MNKSVVGWVVAGLAVLVAASRAGAGTEADYKALFGEEERKVAADTDAKATAAFAAKLLYAARTVGDQKDLQALLCEKAYEFGKKFANVHVMVNAEEKVLSAVEGIGKKGASRIYNWLRGKVT